MAVIFYTLQPPSTAEKHIKLVGCQNGIDLALRAARLVGCLLQVDTVAFEHTFETSVDGSSSCPITSEQHC